MSNILAQRIQNWGFMNKKMILFLVLALSGCSRNKLPVIDTNEVGVTLLLFAGGNCHPCKKEIPEIKKRYLELKKTSEVIIYLVTNKEGSGSVSQKDADEFQKEMSVVWQVVPDGWGMTYYEKYYQDSLAVPATVVLNDKGCAVKIYRPGLVDVDELMARIK